MRSPTPCQEHYQTNTKRCPPEQLFLQSYTGDHGRPADRAPGGQPTAPKWRPPDADSSAVGHPEGAQREAAESQILLLLGTQRGWNSESAGRPRPTEAKTGSPTPCQELYQTNTKSCPPEQFFLQSYTGDHGRPADRAPGGRPTEHRPTRGHPEGAHREAAESRILVLLGIQKASKERPPDRRF